MLVQVDLENEEHCCVLYKLLEERYTEEDNLANTWHSLDHLPSFDEYMEWIKENTPEHFYFWQVRDNLVASVFLRKYDEERYETGCFVLKEYWDKGYGYYAVKALQEKHPVSMICFVNTENVRIKKMIDKLGWRRVSETWIR